MTEKSPSGPRKVFISHSRADDAWASWIEEALGRRGAVVVDPEAKAAGARWADAARAAVANADEVWLILSTISANSSSVQRELEIARETGRPVRVVLVDEDQSVTVDLAADQVLDARSASLRSLERQVAEAIGAAPTPTLSGDYEQAIGVGSDRSAGEPLAVRFPPPPVLPRFVARPTITAALDRALLDDPRPAKAVALIGQAGSGKTVIATKFVADRRWRYRDHAWIHARELPMAMPHIRAISARADGRETLLVIDDVPRPEVLSGLADLPPEVTLLLTAQVPLDFERGIHRDVTCISMTPTFSAEEARSVIRSSVEGLSNEELDRIAEAAGGLPLLVAALAQASASANAEDAIELFDALQRTLTEPAGRYFLDTDDPRVITEWERAFQQLSSEGTSVDLEEFETGSWRRNWRRRYTPERTQEILDSAERAAEVAALTRPESDANRNNAEAIARLMEASIAIPNLVVVSGSVLLIKITDDRGPRLVCRTLTATQLRAFEQNERLLTNPVDALAFLAEAGESLTPRPAIGESP